MSWLYNPGQLEPCDYVDSDTIVSEDIGFVTNRKIFLLIEKNTDKKRHRCRTSILFLSTILATP